jgi:hypothetical protein
MEADEISLDNKSLGEAEQSRNAGQGTGRIMTASDLHATLRRLKLWLIFLACMFAVLLILIVVIGIFTELDGDYLAARISNLEDLAAQQVIWTEKETPPFGYRPAGMVTVFYLFSELKFAIARKHVKPGSDRYFTLARGSRTMDKWN